MVRGLCDCGHRGDFTRDIQYPLKKKRHSRRFQGREVSEEGVAQGQGSAGTEAQRLRRVCSRTGREHRRLAVH